jgi:hypothetical protein
MEKAQARQVRAPQGIPEALLTASSHCGQAQPRNGKAKRARLLSPALCYEGGKGGSAKFVGVMLPGLLNVILPGNTFRAAVRLSCLRDNLLGLIRAD